MTLIVIFDKFVYDICKAITVSKKLIIHRDVSWLSFNYRVLQEAMDKSVPLLDRLKFLAIYSSNLDEFFRVRIANHRNLVRAGKKTLRQLSIPPDELLAQLLDIVNKQQELFSRIFEDMLIPELKQHGISLLRRNELNESQTSFVEKYFEENLMPYVQPVLLKGNKIKPFLNNGALYLSIILEDKSKAEKQQFAIVKIPSDHVSRFIILPSIKENTHDIIMLDDVVRHSLSLIFPGYDIVNSFSIKLTRDAELYIDDEFSGDLISKIRKSLNKRHVGPASRLVYDREMSQEFLQYLTDVLELSNFDLLPEGRYHNNSDFFQFPTFGFNHLKETPLPPIPYDPLENSKDFFASIREKDHLINVPFHNYESVIRFFEESARDPRVTHIKIVQYRVASESRIMDAIIEAVASGKSVSAFIEVKARFDEEANLKWGEVLEQAGVQVHYSMPGLKVHTKMALVRRIEEGKPRIYSYMSTGNFHEVTAKIYTDLGFFTADKRITSEVSRLFKYLETKKEPDTDFTYLLVGQFNLKDSLIDFIHQEIENHKNGLPSGITLKLNSIQDKEMINELYKSSQAGVKTKLICRGICSIIPGIENISDNIEAFSIVDRFLEHSRIYIFENAGNPRVFISSADWMVRNLNYRIETAVEIYDDQIKKTIFDVIAIQSSDNIKSRSLHYGEINQYRNSSSDLAIRSQIETYYYFKRKADASKLEMQTTDDNNSNIQ